MAMIKCNLVARSFEDQVLKNKSDIEDILGNTVTGFKVVGSADTFEDLPDEESEEFAALELGDAYAVGTEAPYVYYIKVKENDSYEDH